ncbi:MAG TPA: hypothetical protein VGP47_02830, partial [Parachlamydiaceae bacterium]|nr:hypothetical protein [Parachlamydiaceae bacterium]
ALIHEIVIHEDSINIKHCIPMTQTSNTTSKKCLLRDKRSAAASTAKKVIIFLVTYDIGLRGWGKTNVSVK